jgi:hypothetical protein
VTATLEFEALWHKLNVTVTVKECLASVSLVLLHLASGALQYSSSIPVTSAKLEGFSANEIVVDLPAVFDVNNLSHVLKLFRFVF